MTSQAIAERSDSSNVSGIRGWLLVPAIVTCAGPLAYAVVAVEAFMLYSPDAPTLQGAWFLGKAAVLAALMLAWAYAVRLLFTRSREYPRLFIALTLAGLAVGVASLVALKPVFGVNPGHQDVKALVMEAIGAAIWFSYMRLSDRVRNTFT
jgi:hypothetical protein